MKTFALYHRTLAYRWLIQQSGWIVFGFSALMMAMMLGSRGLNEPDEGRYASVAVEMLRSGDWLTPRFEGHAHLTKPPLTYWLMAGSMRLLGINEGAARLPSALAGLGCILLTWSMARRWHHVRVSLLAAIMLLFSPLFFVMARVADPNMLLTFFVTLAVWSWLRYQDREGVVFRWVFYIALGLAMLTKGPVVLILVGLPVFFMARARRCIGDSPATWSWAGALLAIGMGFGWHIWMVMGDSSLAGYFVGEEVLARVAGTSHHRNEPAWFYIPVILGGFLPWLVFLWFGLLDIRRNSSVHTLVTRPLAVALACEVVFFTLVRSKLPTYVLPMFPWLALIAAPAITSPGMSRRARWVGFLLPLAIAVVAPGIALGYFHPSLSQHLIVLALATCGAIIAFVFLHAHGYRFARVFRLFIIFALSYASLLHIQLHMEETMGHAGTHRTLLREIRKRMQVSPGRIMASSTPAAWAFYTRQPWPKERLDIVTSQGRLKATNLHDFLHELEQQSQDQPVYLLIKKDHFQQTNTRIREHLTPVQEDARFILLHAS